MLSLLTLGFLLGMRHAFEADHLAAVASITVNTSSYKQAARHGAIWGLGHTIALFIFGAIAIFLDTKISEQFSNILETAVGIMLIALGADVLYRLIKNKIHFHTHQHNNSQPHFHAHSHANESMKNHKASSHNHRHNQNFPYRSLLVGLMHGMAGSAALIILALKTVSSVTTGLIYILLFGIGSICGMAVLSTIIALPLLKSDTRITWVYNGLHLVTGVITIGLGLFVVFSDYNFELYSYGIVTQLSSYRDIE